MHFFSLNKLLLKISDNCQENTSARSGNGFMDEMYEMDRTYQKC